jgi:hypothetical protein
MIAKISMFALKALMLLPLLGGANAAFAAQVEAKKDIDIFKEPTNKSEVLGKLKTGEAVDSVERKGMFWEVKTKDGATGYVSVLSVKHNADTDGNLAKAIKNAVKQGRPDDDSEDSRQRSAVMGVRGLAEDESAGNASALRPNLRAVFAMEEINPRQKDLEVLGGEILAEIEKKASAE